MRFHFKNNGVQVPESTRGIAFRKADSLTRRTYFVPQTECDAAWSMAEERLRLAELQCATELADAIHNILTEGRMDFESSVKPSWVSNFPSGFLQDARLGDRAFIYAAIACCLYSGCDPEKLAVLRVLALTDEFPERLKSDLHQKVKSWGSVSESESADFEAILVTACLVAGDPLSWTGSKWEPSRGEVSCDPKADFTAHPLHGRGRVGLLMGGAQFVKGYFFESARLPEIRGASGLLEYANERVLQKVYGASGVIAAPECIVFAAGGSFLSFAPVAKMNEIADAIEREYSELTLTAFSAAAARDFDLLELHYGLSPHVMRASQQNTNAGFGELCHYLSGAVQERRAGTPLENRQELPLPYQPEAHPMLERCTSCGHRPVIAIPYARPEEGEPRGLCESCARKALVGRFTKTEKVDQLYLKVADQIGWSIDKLPYPMQGWLAAFSEYLAAKSTLQSQYLGVGESSEEHRAPRAANDLQEIASGGPGVAMIYADGNNVSAILAAVKTPSLYKQLSERLSATCRESVFFSIASNLRATTFHPFEILSIGGDDLMLIVPAKHALDIALDIGNMFEKLWNAPDENYTLLHRYAGEQTKEFAAAPVLSLAIGVVMADASTPVGYLRDLSEELLKQAKKKSRELKKSAGPATKPVSFGAVDFQVLKSTGNILEDISSYRASVLQRNVAVRGTGRGEKNEYTLKLTARPYSLRELDGLIKTAKDFRNASIPRSQLYSLRTSLLTSKTRSILQYLYTKKRSHGRTLEMFEHLEQNWYPRNPGARPKRPDPSQSFVDPPWVSADNKVFETFLADIIEVMPFVSETTHKEKAHVAK